ncbi:TPA: aldehyde dehydrogenase family protein, partial [Klebsiella pneumoniae]
DGGGRGPQFTRLPFNHLFFTGSVRTGRAVMAQCAANLTPVTLELGGKSPAVVAADFDLRRAAERIIWSKLLNAGQICTNIDYLLLPEGREQAFVEQAQAVARRRYPDLCNGDYTAIIDQRQYDRLQALLEDARSKGARIIPLLPEQPGDPARRILPPQLLLDVSDDMRVMQEEIFGPLLPLRSYRDHAEALAQIDRLPSPLALYLFSNLQALQQFYLHNSLSGGVTLNDG